MKKIIQRSALALALLLIIIAGYLWVVLLAPWGYEYPEAYYPPVEGASVTAESDSQQTVFVYGTLRYRWVRLLVMRAQGAPQVAILEGYRRRGLDLEPDVTARVQGLLLTVTARQLRRLDRYERLGVRYQRQQVELADGTNAWVYLRNPPAP